MKLKLIFFRNSLAFFWSNGCWQLDLWFLPALCWIRIRGCGSFLIGGTGLWGKSRSCSNGWGHAHNKSLIQNFLLIGGAVLAPCILAWGQTMVGIIVTSFKRTCVSMPYDSQDCCIQIPWPCIRPLSTHASGDSWILIGKSDSMWIHYSILLGPNVHKVCLCPPRVCFPSPVEVL